MTTQALKRRRAAPARHSNRFGSHARQDIFGALNALLADVFALDEQNDQVLAVSDPMAERVRKIDGTTLRSIGHVGRLRRVLDNDSDDVTPLDMLAELREDNIQSAIQMRKAHGLCNEHGDVASASLFETWIDEAEHRAWFLFETTAGAEKSD